MAYKDDKVIGILLEQSSAIDERCEGYRDELKEAVADIIMLERRHKFAKINIAIQVGDVVGRVGTFLHSRSTAAKG